MSCQELTGKEDRANDAEKSSPGEGFDLLDPAIPEARTRPFQLLKNHFLKSIQSDFVSLMTEGALSSILSLSFVKDTGTQEQTPYLALKLSAQNLEKLPKLTQGRLWNGACVSH